MPNPSMTIHVRGSKHYTWNTATIHILIMPLLCIHPRGAHTHAHPHTDTHNVHTYLFICHSIDRCSQNRPSVESTELERKRKKRRKKKTHSVVESRSWETLFLLIIMTSPHCLSFSRGSRQQRSCNASSVSEQTLVKWCAMCWSSIRRSQHLSVKSMDRCLSSWYYIRLIFFAISLLRNDRQNQQNGGFSRSGRSGRRPSERPDRY